MKVQSSASDFFLAAIAPTLPLCRERMVYAYIDNYSFNTNVHTAYLQSQLVSEKSASGAQ